MRLLQEKIMWTVTCDQDVGLNDSLVKHRIMFIYQNCYNFVQDMVAYM